VLRARTVSVAAVLILIAVLAPACSSGTPTRRDTTAAPSTASSGASATASAAAGCVAERPAHWAPATGLADDRGSLRVVAVQYQQSLRPLTSYASWQHRMDCLLADLVLPLRTPGRPLLAVLPEDIGLSLLALGDRGAVARARSTSVLDALARLRQAYGPQVAEYTRRFGALNPKKALLIAASDTLGRAFEQTFADLARKHAIYLVAGVDEADLRRSTNPSDAAALRDPAVRTGPTWVAASPRVTNQTVLWGPDGAVLARNVKVPLTEIESSVLGIDPGPAGGPEARANLQPVTVGGLRLGFATSLPAFQYGYDFGARRPAGDPCADVRRTYVPCLDSLRTDVMVQADANPGQWATAAQSGGWQPLEWMGSAWRAVADPTVRIRYAVNPMMTGNLLDLPFDGQSAITARSAGQPGLGYVGDAARAATDPRAYSAYAGDKPHFLALAPWVAPDADRATLARRSAVLPRGGGYLETAVWADLRSAG